MGITDLAREISPALAKDTVVVSVAAAVSIAQLEAALPDGQPVIRTMPNTPSKLGRGVISVSPGTHCTAVQLESAKAAFAGAGKVVEIPEEQVDALSAISGSGPAYAFYLAEAMAAAGVELGLDEELSVMLARETVAGAGFMLAEPGADPSALRKAVTSPNGTTERAIAAFDDGGLPKIIAEAPGLPQRGQLRSPRSLADRQGGAAPPRPHRQGRAAKAAPRSAPTSPRVRIRSACRVRTLWFPAGHT